MIRKTEIIQHRAGWLSGQRVLRLFFVPFLVVCGNLATAQIYNNPGGTINTCSGSFFDTGGSAGSYADNEFITTTFCSSAGNCIQATFNSFETESGFDVLTIYDGPNTLSPVIGAYSGTTSPGTIFSSAGGCLTFNFSSDGSVFESGWDASLTCITCPTCSDGIQNGNETGVDCGGTSCPACPCPVNQVIGSLPFSQSGLNTSGAQDDFTSSDACGSLYMDGDDYVFEYTPAVNECISVTLSGTGTYTGVFVTEGCPNYTCAQCTAMNTNSGGNPAIANASLVAGTTYYITVSTWPTPQSTAFNINVQTVACGGSLGNDACSSAQPIVQGLGNLNGSTTGYTADTPDNLNSVFCGSIENNQWYSFVATATSATFNITAVGGSNCPYGIQAEVYSAASGGSCGNCQSFASMSNCFNPGTTSTGTVTATGLTIGNTYLLMIDGNAGSECTYTIANWANTTLPVALLSFEGYNVGEENELTWATQHEINSAYFQVERSEDGVTYAVLTQVQAAGNSDEPRTYSVTDPAAPAGKGYYQLREFDINGSETHTETIMVKRSDALEMNVHPNPATHEITITGNAKLKDCSIRVLTLLGREVAVPYTFVHNQEARLDISRLPKGVFLVFVSDGFNSTQMRFVKE